MVDPPLGRNERIRILKRPALLVLQCQIAKKRAGARQRTSRPKNNMASSKKKASAKAAVKFKDLKSHKNPKGGAFDAYMKLEPGAATPKLAWIEIK
jgi:hypothetical protein